MGWACIWGVYSSSGVCSDLFLSSSHEPMFVLVSLVGVRRSGGV